ncbi:hypothetical protein HAALTHF_29400n [Vreelandella aquamarina]|nr:hypothetical protein HAALTHF_29400n [Halomonas axialensis]
MNYLKAMLGDERHQVLFVGYQGAGTLSRAIQQYGPRGGWVEIDNQRYDIKAGVTSISGYSAHADQKACSTSSNACAAGPIPFIWYTANQPPAARSNVSWKRCTPVKEGGVRVVNGG